jgi:hypothetical protein
MKYDNINHNIKMSTDSKKEIYENTKIDPDTLYYHKQISKKMLRIKRKRIKFLKKNSFNLREFRNKAIGDVIKNQNEQYNLFKKI